MALNDSFIYIRPGIADIFGETMLVWSLKVAVLVKNGRKKRPQKL